VIYVIGTVGTSYMHTSSTFKQFLKNHSASPIIWYGTVLLSNPLLNQDKKGLLPSEGPV
jgi:hypothetical protein